MPPDRLWVRRILRRRPARSGLDAGPATRDLGGLDRLADWLTACRITHAAMEATGVYWIPIFEILEARGFAVIVVDARFM